MTGRPAVIIDGAVPRSPFERVRRIVAAMADDVPINYEPVLRATLAHNADDDELVTHHEDRLIEQLNAWLLPNRRQVLMPGNDPGDLLLLSVNKYDEPIDGEGRPWLP